MSADTDRRLGEISTAPDGTLTLRFERRLAHPPEAVWAALTEPALEAQRERAVGCRRDLSEAAVGICAHA